jgi:hypothetical protein
MQTAPATANTTKRYFAMSDGDLDYTIVANDLEHAKQIVRASGVEFHDPSVPFDKAELEWKEIDAGRAADIRVRDDDQRGAGPDGNGWPLTTFEPGDWFCSEW